MRWQKAGGKGFVDAGQVAISAQLSLFSRSQVQCLRRSCSRKLLPGPYVIRVSDSDVLEFC